MIKQKILCLTFVMFLLASCASVSLQRQYSSEAREVSDKYGLTDATISMDHLKAPDPDTIYSLLVRSNKFSDLSNEQKYLYLYELNQIVADSDYRISVTVISGMVYQLSPRFDVAFVENNSPIFPYGTPTGLPPSRIVFDPPVEVELISNTELDFLLAGDTATLVMDYEDNHWSLPYEERVRLN